MKANESLAAISCLSGDILNGFFTNYPVVLFNTGRRAQSTKTGKPNLFSKVNDLGSLILLFSVKPKSTLSCESLSSFKFDDET